MKDDLEFTTGNKKVRLSIPDGLPAFTWYLYVDDYYRGRLEKKDGEWRSIDLRQPDKVAAIGKRIDIWLKENGADAGELEQGGFEKHRE